MPKSTTGKPSQKVWRPRARRRAGSTFVLEPLLMESQTRCPACQNWWGAMLHNSHGDRDAGHPNCTSETGPTNRAWDPHDWGGTDEIVQFVTWPGRVQRSCSSAFGEIWESGPSSAHSIQFSKTPITRGSVSLIQRRTFMLRNKSSRIRLHASDHWDASSSAIDTSKASVAIHRRDCDICAQKRSWALQALTHTSVWNLTFYALVLRYSLTTFYNALVNDWSQIQIITSCCYLLFWWFDDHEPWFQGRDSGFQYNYFLAACGHNSYQMRHA